MGGGGEGKPLAGGVDDGVGGGGEGGGGDGGGDGGGGGGAILIKRHRILSEERMLARVIVFLGYSHLAELAAVGANLPRYLLPLQLSVRIAAERPYTLDWPLIPLNFQRKPFNRVPRST